MTQSDINSQARDVDQKEGPNPWQESPTRTISLLPPFGVSQPSHLPTPQSPGNVAGYLMAPLKSPLSEAQSSARRAFPSAPNFSSSVMSRKRSSTPQHEPSTSSSKISSRTPRVKSEQEKARVLAWSHSSQIATPSPEITRTRHVSATDVLSDTETAAPSAGNPMSSNLYSGNTTLAPAPIISSAGASHSSMYHLPPEIPFGKRAGPSYNVPYDMTSLAPERNTSQYQDTTALADPFLVPVVSNDGVRKEGPSRKQYHSPSISRNSRPSSAHGSDSPLRGPVASHGKSAMVRLVGSPSESSNSGVLSFGSRMKVEAEGSEEGVAMRTLRPAVPNNVMPQTRPSPCTPPPLGSAGASDIVFSSPPLERSALRTPPHIVDEEVEHARQRETELTESHGVGSEKRPDYLVRTKRARADPDDEEAFRERESALPGLAITVSPAKGRRIKLYHPVPVSGDTVLGDECHSDPGGAEPSTPPPLGALAFSSVPVLSMRAIDWQTPRQRHTSSLTWTEEDERKKQKRLAAFAAPVSSGSSRRLKPVDVPGQGRVVIDVSSEETRALAEAGILEMPPDTPVDPEVFVANGHGTEWPDSEYPWSLQRQQRHEEEEFEKRQRLRWIERFLDRESESDDDDHEATPDPFISLPTNIDTSSSLRAPQGRGKSVSLRVVPGSQCTTITDRRVFGAASADAREVLLSKKHVREVAERIRRRKAAEEEEGVVMCVCQGADDGRPMVRCDQCRTWYHLVCMDITDESELGDEWFCWKCAPSADDPSQAPVFEPTFAPVMPDTPPRTSVGDLPLYQTALQPSPILEMRTRVPTSPPVISHPSRDRDRERSPPRRSRLHHVLGDPDDPVRGGPSTPYHARSLDSRLYSTPKFYEEYTGDEYMPFDPTSTPSRGLKFPNPVPITPRRPPTWAGQNLLWATPSGLSRSPQFSLQTPSSSARSLAYSLSTMEDSGGPLTSPWPPDESPVRRPHKPSESNQPYVPPRRLLDSPLAARGGGNRALLLGVEDSPSATIYAPQ